MQAVVYQGFGSPDILHLREIDKPVPGDGEVLIKVRAASVNPLDWKLMKGGPLLARLLIGSGKPKIKCPGVDVAGEVEALGKNITGLKPGDEVFGTCVGAFAEYATSKSAPGMKSALARKPPIVTFEQAAAVPVAGLTALQCLRDIGKIQPGQSVLINGASGGVGTFAVQLAKSFGANVTGVCSTANADLVRSLGADRVMDYTQQDFTNAEERYHLIFDRVGNRPLSAMRRALHPRGTLVWIGLPPSASLSRFPARVIGALLFSPFTRTRTAFFIAKVNQKDLTTLGELLSTGELKPVIAKRFPLSEAPDAFRYLETGHGRGKVILTPESQSLTN